MKRVVLMANDRPGVEVAEYLISQKDKIVRLYLHEKESQKSGPEIIKASGLNKEDIFEAGKIAGPGGVRGLKELNPDYIITVYWSHLLKKDVIDCAREGTVNFHPALLPINRGWYPHVHSILDGSPTGVTLHQIAEDADSGPIWGQRRVLLTEYDTAFTIYNRLQDEIVKLFKEVWPRIKNKKIEPILQDDSKAVYHKKSEIKALDKIDPESVMKAGDLIKLLRARSFGSKGFAYYEKDGRKVYLNLRLNKSASFEKE